ncbi:MAG: sigma factor [Christensenellales bacterium]
MKHEIVDRVYAAKGNSLAADKLIYDYLPFIKAEASKATGKIIRDSDDELNIAMLAFHEAVEGYSQLRGAFLKYAAVIMRRKIIDYFRTQQRHAGQISLDTPLNNDSDDTLKDVIASSADDYGERHTRAATKEEIEELAAQMKDFDISLTDIADNCPKQDRTLAACKKALAYAKENPFIIDELKRTKKLPITKLASGSGTQRKTLERHRKYIVALLLIFSNGYEIIRGHLRQVLQTREGGGEV